MMRARTFLWTISITLVAVAGCGGDDTSIDKSSTTSGSTSASSSGEGGMGTGGTGGMGNGGTGGMATGGTGGMATGGAGGMATGGAGGMGTGGTGGMGTGGMGTGGMGGMAAGGAGGMGGTGGMGGSGGMGGGGGAGGGPTAMCNPEGPFDGAPVTAQANQWTWVPMPEAKCRNGSSTGFGVRINPNSTKVVIYFQGGGACFNGATCLGNPSSYGSNNFGNGPSGGLFDRNNAANPLKDWSFVYFPYCTGDVFTGNATNVDVPGGFGAPQNQSFVGYANVGYYLKRVIPTFPNVTQVLVTGESAGGFGAFYNYDRIAQAFCPTPTALIDDSGPPMSDTYMAPCLQQRWRTLYNINGTLPKDCTDCSLPNGGGLVNAWKLLAQKYPTADLGLISSNRDSTIRQFYGFGQNNCAQIDGFGSSLPEATYAAGLTEVRDLYLKPSPAWSTFFINSTAHTYLGGGSYYTTTVMGTAMTTWVAGIVDGGAAVHVGP